MYQPTKETIESPDRLLHHLRELGDQFTSLRNEFEKSQFDANSQKQEMAKLSAHNRENQLLRGVKDGPSALVRLGVDELATKKSNLAAIVGPGADDDETAGYSRGSLWFVDDVTPEVWFCVRADRGTASWIQLF